MSKVIKGSIEPQLRITRIRFDPTNGETVTTEYESPGDNLGGLAAKLRSQGIAFEHEFNRSRSRLVATASRNRAVSETPVERWELFSNQNMPDVREHPKSVALGKTLLARVLKDWKRHESGKEVDTGAYENANAAMLFDLLTRGATHYPVWNWTIRYTANISNEYNAFTQANSGVGTIFTTSQIAADVPAGRLRSTIQSITAPPEDSAMVWGWLKMSVTEIHTGGNRIEVSSEAQLAQWSSFIYT